MYKLHFPFFIIGIHLGPVWYSFMSSFTSSFTTSIAKQPTLCPTLWPASLKTHSHRVKHMVKLPKHGSLPRSWSCSWSCFLKNSSTGEAELCQTGPFWPTSSFPPLSIVFTRRVRSNRVAYKAYAIYLSRQPIIIYTYHVQTNLFMQLCKLLIWVVGCWSKGITD
jgi:hypothetical protein